MRANALVVGSSLPWAVFDDVPSGEERIEAFLQAGKVRSDEELERIAEAELARFRDGQSQITLGVDPTTGDVPFDDFTVGDTVSVDGATRRVVSLTFGRDPRRDGRLVYVPQVGDLIPDPEARKEWAQKKMTNGSLGGSSRAATQAPPPLVPNPDTTVGIVTVRLTQAEYDALDPVMPNVLYVIVD